MDDDIDIYNWNDVEETALAYDTCMEQDINNSDPRDAVDSIDNGAVESEQYVQDKDDDSAFVKDNDSAIVSDDDSAFMSSDDSVIVRDESKLPKPSLSWSQTQTIMIVEDWSTED